MNTTVDRRRFLAALSAAGALGAGPLWAESALAPAASLRPRPRGADLLRRSAPTLEQVLAEAKLSGDVSCAVMDLRSGRLMEGHRADRALPPASVAKAITACYALTHLGPGHHFATRVIATGGVSGGVVRGDLILAGGGDPSLDTDGLAELAALLKAAGIRSVQGRFLVWGGALPGVQAIDAEQPDHVGYNPAISGLNLNYNRVHFEWRRNGAAYQVSMDARSEKYRPEVKFARMSVAARDLPVYTYSGRDDRDSWTVARGALGKGGARWLPVRHPELYAGEVFQVFARSQGIELKAPARVASLPAGTVLAERQSQPLRVILRDMLKYSTNLTAEAVGLSATAAKTGRAAGLRQSAEEMSRWARGKYGLAGPRFVDHSGLGADSRISATDMARALVAVHGQLGLEPLLKPFAMRDDNRKVVKEHPVEVRAKTGTLNFVSGLAGYMTSRAGTQMAFAIFSADLTQRARIPRSEMESPAGASAWNTRSRKLQQALIDRWDLAYGT